MENSVLTVKTTATINILAGIWLFISTWVYHFQASANAWNSWIVGCLIVLFGAIRLADTTTGESFSFLNLLLGAWVFASPWIYRYTGDSGRFANSICIGIIVFVCGIIAFTAMHHNKPPLPTSRA